MHNGAGEESRTPVLALGRPHNSRYTTPACEQSASQTSEAFGELSGATYRDRTGDLRFTKAAL